MKSSFSEYFSQDERKKSNGPDNDAKKGTQRAQIYTH